jgi:formate C-acetyltransferase
MQHQPNIVDKATLLSAQDAPEKYKDLIVRLWGVSAHFVDLPKDIQDELIARLA